MNKEIVKGLSNMINQMLHHIAPANLAEDIINCYGEAVKKLAYQKGNGKKINVGFAKVTLKAEHEMDMDLTKEFIEIYNHGGQVDILMFSPSEKLVELFTEKMEETTEIETEIAAGLLSCLFTSILIYVKKKIKDGKEVEVVIPNVGNIVFIDYNGGIVASLRAATDFVKVVG
jgi:hypothetical protein